MPPPLRRIIFRCVVLVAVSSISFALWRHFSTAPAFLPIHPPSALSSRSTRATYDDAVQTAVVDGLLYQLEVLGSQIPTSIPRIPSVMAFQDLAIAVKYCDMSGSDELSQQFKEILDITKKLQRAHIRFESKVRSATHFIRACQESHIDMKMHRHALSLEISPMITRGKSWLALFDDCEERFSGLTAAIHNVSSNAGDRTAALADLWVACGQDQGSAAFKSLHHFWTDLKAAHSHVMRILRAVEMLQDALGESHIDRA